MLKRAIIASFAILAIASVAADAKTAADLDDLEIAHVAYTADNIDIRYAHLALAKSKDPAVHRFAKTMIRDHNAVNERALALVAKLKASPKDNFLSLATGRSSVPETSPRRSPMTIASLASPTTSRRPRPTLSNVSIPCRRGRMSNVRNA